MADSHALTIARYVSPVSSNQKLTLQVSNAPQLSELGFQEANAAPAGPPASPLTHPAHLQEDGCCVVRLAGVHVGARCAVDPVRAPEHVESKVLAVRPVCLLIGLDSWLVLLTLQKRGLDEA